MVEDLALLNLLLEKKLSKHFTSMLGKKTAFLDFPKPVSLVFLFCKTGLTGFPILQNRFYWFSDFPTLV